MGNRGNTETALRQWLQRQLRVDDVQLAWLWLQLPEYDDKLIPEALDGGEEEQADLLCVAKRLLDFGRTYPATGRSRSSGPGIGADGGLQRSRTETTERPFVMTALTPREQLRAVVVSQALAHDAEQQDHLWRFRLEVVGRVLSSVEARAFVASPANAIFTIDELRDSGIPIVGHHAILSSRQLDGDVLRAEVAFEPSGRYLGDGTPRNLAARRAATGGIC